MDEDLSLQESECWDCEFSIKDLIQSREYVYMATNEGHKYDDGYKGFKLYFPIPNESYDNYQSFIEVGINDGGFTYDGNITFNNNISKIKNVFKLPTLNAINLMMMYRNLVLDASYLESELVSVSLKMKDTNKNLFDFPDTVRFEIK